MDLRTLLGSSAARQTAGALAYVVGAGGALTLVVAAGLTPVQRRAVRDALAEQVPTLVLGAVLALTGLAVLLWRWLGPWAGVARRLSGDVRLLLGANPHHRLQPSGPPALVELAGAVNELADRRAAAEGDVAREVETARADVERERNRLAAVMADLTVAVLVCSPGGRIVLYNSAARALLADDPALGLGRSVFGIIDRGLVTHALDRVADGRAPAHVSTVLRGGSLLQVRLAPVRGDDSDGARRSDFVLLLEDTSHLQAGRRREALLRSLTESTRASAASIRAAVEALLDYPDMAPPERAQFLRILDEEAQQLGTQVEQWSADAVELGGDWVLADVRGDDLLAVLGREVQRRAGVSAQVRAGGGDLWLRADSHDLARALEHLAVRLRESCGAQEVVLSLTAAGRHARLDVAWTGTALDAPSLRAWLDEPAGGGAGGTVREVVERHDAEVWSGAATDDATDEERLDGTAYLRVLLPATEDAPRAQALPPAEAPSRPELYDFDLFDLAEQALAWHDRPLTDLAYAVFDTETTGFHPDAGDQILSVGAVRVVGGRLRRQEVFEQLVDPGRPVPAASSAVHGITADMLRGQPRLEEVLPAFERFCEDTVLVGHNVGFDMSFLRAAEDRTGVRLAQPVLDTLLLDAALHPDHEHHSLEAISARLGLDVLGRHTALGDALLTGEVFVRLLALLQQRGIRTLGEALAASRATYQARLDATLYGGGR